MADIFNSHISLAEGGAAVKTQTEKEALKEKINQILNEEYAVEYLASLMRMPSETLKPAYAQELVLAKMKELGFATEMFPCYVDEIRDLPDFFHAEGNDVYRPDILNLVGVKEGVSEGKGNALMLHAHIDTSPSFPGICSPENVHREGSRLYGLGACDDKGGVATMMMAAEAVIKTAGPLDGKLTLMSSIGKRGAIGTLTSCLKGYGGDGAIYLHPAETGHGFREIKNYSMGTTDLILTITGKKGKDQNETDDSEVNAVIKGAETVLAVKAWEKERRKKHLFADSTFAGSPCTKTDITNARATAMTPDDVTEYELSVRVIFGLDETPESVRNELADYLAETFKDDEWMSANPVRITLGERQGSPITVGREEQIVQTLEKNITEIKKFDDFIYQYHGTSDIRMPIIYGNTPTVGVGALCGGLHPGIDEEWIDLKDYIDGIKIMAGVIIDWCL